MKLFITFAVLLLVGAKIGECSSQPDVVEGDQEDAKLSRRLKSIESKLNRVSSKVRRLDKKLDKVMGIIYVLEAEETRIDVKGFSSKPARRGGTTTTPSFPSAPSPPHPNSSKSLSAESALTTGNPVKVGCPPPELDFVCKCIVFRASGVFLNCSNRLYADIKKSLTKWDKVLPASADKSLHKFYASPMLFGSHPNHLEEDFFSGFTFKDITIQKSLLHSFDSNVFDGVRELDLSYNNLTSNSVLQNFMKNNTRRLNLNYNQLTEVPNFYPDLDVLELKNNRIQEVGPIAFKGHYFNLDRNPISFIKRDAFQPKGHLFVFLRKSSLNENSLQPGFVDVEGLTNRTHELYLFLEDNSITFIPREVFQPLLEVNSYFELTSNPLLCNCDMQWLLEENLECDADRGPVFKSKLSFHYKGWKCPEGRSFFSYTGDDFLKCNDVLTLCK